MKKPQKKKNEGKRGVKSVNFASNEREKADNTMSSAKKRPVELTSRMKQTLKNVDNRVIRAINRIEDISTLHVLPFYNARSFMLTVVGLLTVFVATNGFRDLAIMVQTQMKWFSIYAVILLAFYWFTTPFRDNLEVRNRFNNYFVLTTCLAVWLAAALFYHLPSFVDMGIDARISVSLYLIVFLASVIILLLIHIVNATVSYLMRKHVSERWAWSMGTQYDKGMRAGLWSDFEGIVRISFVVSIACCIFYERCGNIGQDAHILPSQENNTDYVLQILKEGVCDYWLAARLATDHATFKFLVVYGEVVKDDVLNNNTEKFISPVFTLWVTFIALYLTNYFVEHTRSWERTESVRKVATKSDVSGVSSVPSNLEQSETQPAFLPMVAWFTGTSMDLWIAIFDIVVGGLLGRFDTMRTLHAATDYHERDDASSTDARGNATNGNSEDGFTYEHFAERTNFWFDYMADSGDGGDSSYTVANMLAQPKLVVKKKQNMNGDKDEDEFLVLPRGELLLHGGDLAYPGPNRESYHTRLFYPFEQAMSPPCWFDRASIAIRKPDLPSGYGLGDYYGPQCFAIPGNHDWFDGLQTFIRYICHGSWLGGWLLPQEKSYFALKLPQNWWVFGFDLGFSEDLNLTQFKYFVNVIDTKMKEGDRVVCIQHMPSWLLPAPPEGGRIHGLEYSCEEGLNLAYLMQNYLQGKAPLRLSGDLHCYMRHTRKKESTSEEPETTSQSCFSSSLSGKRAASFSPRAAGGSWAGVNQLSDNKRTLSPEPILATEHFVVSGGGGAFLHPTHVHNKARTYAGVTYEFVKSFPSAYWSKFVGFGNLFEFRQKNWRFDLVGGCLYFLLVCSLFPLCRTNVDLSALTNSETLASSSYMEILAAFFFILKETFYALLAETNVSLGFMILFVPVALVFAERMAPLPVRLLLGLTHVTIHVVLALSLLILMEAGLVLMIEHKMLGNDGFYTLYESFISHQETHFPDPNGLRANIEYYSFGIYPATVKYFLTLFDVPEVTAVLRQNVCAEGIEVIPRWQSIIYYFGMFLYYWVLAAPLCSFVIGMYLFVSVNILGMHWDTAFSSMRNKHFKNFMRFHIDDATGDLEVFTIGIDRVPHKWKRDPKFAPRSFDSYLRRGEKADEKSLTSDSDDDLSLIRRNSEYKNKVFRRKSRQHSVSTEEEVPSRWKADRTCPMKPRIIDHFVIKKTSTEGHKRPTKRK